MVQIITSSSYEYQTPHLCPFVAGLSYDLYTGFHQWRKVRVETGFSWEVLKGNIEQIPGLLQKMGRLAVFTNSNFGKCRMCRMFMTMCTLEHQICTRLLRSFLHSAVVFNVTEPIKMFWSLPMLTPFMRVTSCQSRRSLFRVDSFETYILKFTDSRTFSQIIVILH